MAKLGQKKTGAVISGNITAETGYGIVYADEIIGHRRVNTYSDLAKIPNWCLYNKAGGDAASTAVGQLWYVTTGDTSHSAGLYQLIAFDGSTRTWKYFKNGADVADSDTTYTFANGTDGSFTVTPKNGKAQTVTIGKVANTTHADKADLATNATYATSAGSANTANSATKATQDGNGNVITSTYATKDSLKNYATLDSTGLIPASLLPSYVDDVVEFKGITTLSGGEKSTTETIGIVLYSSTDKQFIFCTGIQQPTADNCYNYWGDSENYNDVSGDTITPLSGKIFVNTLDNNTYRWSGSNLVEISKSYGLGRTEGTAFPGDAGKSLEETAVKTLETIASNSIIIGQGGKVVKQFNATSTAGYLYWTGAQYAWKTPATFSLSKANDKDLGGIKVGYRSNGKNYAVQVDNTGNAYVNVPWTDTDTKYSLSAATSSVMGGVKLASDTPQSVAANAITNTASRTYGVQKNSNGQLVVNVPWVNTVTIVERIPDNTIKNTFNR